MGGDRWAVELTEAEFVDFCRLAQQLADTVRSLAAELMDEERVACEQETAHLWMEIEGFPTSFELRFLLLQGRQAEGGWPETVAAEIVKAIPSLMLF